MRVTLPLAGGWNKINGHCIRVQENKWLSKDMVKL